MHKRQLKKSSTAKQSPAHWSDYVREIKPPSRKRELLVGVLRGEGIGPEVTASALQVLSALESVTDLRFQIDYGTAIGRDAERGGKKVLPEEVIEFCGDIFARGGAVLNGPGGGRYVYDLRRAFDLYCKLSPIKVAPELAKANHLKPEHVQGVDILMVRENASGIYQGVWKVGKSKKSGRTADHYFSYSEAEVNRILRPAAEIACTRRKELTVVYKEAGVPAISELWRDCAIEVCKAHDVRCILLDIDHISYRIIQHPREFDVVVAPNLFGDVLSDLGGALLGSRGLCYAGSFGGKGEAVYSTNHGAAYDLARRNLANPVAHISSMAMMLRQSFGFDEEAALIEQAIPAVWQDGWRTPDLVEPGCKMIGTNEMAQRIADKVQVLGGAKAKAAQSRAAR
jgi:3-isopropylmalate dehydrogenase